MAGKGRGGVAVPDPIIPDGIDDDEDLSDAFGPDPNIDSVPVPSNLMAGQTYAPPNDSPNGKAAGDFMDVLRSMRDQMTQVNDRIGALEQQNTQLAVRLVQAESKGTAVAPAGIDPVALEQATDRTIASAAGAGLIAPPQVNPMPTHEGLDPHRMVAFIPKEDLLNPKFVVFETFCNGQRMRIRRGSVGMLPLGHACLLYTSDAADE